MTQEHISTEQDRPPSTNSDAPDSAGGDDDEPLRRDVLAAMAGVAAAGAGGYFVGTAKAAPTGVFPVATDAPLLKIRADRVRLIGRTSDPSSPSDGTLWYRSDL